MSMSTSHEDAVRERAYFLWIREGQPDDRHMEHWLQALAEIEEAEAEPETAAAE